MRFHCLRDFRLSRQMLIFELKWLNEKEKNIEHQMEVMIECWRRNGMRLLKLDLNLEYLNMTIKVDFKLLFPRQSRDFSFVWKKVKNQAKDIKSKTFQAKGDGLEFIVQHELQPRDRHQALILVNWSFKWQVTLQDRILSSESS